MINSNNINLKQAIRNMAASLMLIIIFITGCNGQNILDAVFTSEDTAPGENLTQEPLQEESVIATPAPTENSFPINDISIWLPPQFDPNANTESGKIMLAHIESFQELYPQYTLDIRVKADSGSSSLLNALLTTSSAAPGVLPSVVLISRSDLEIAAAQGIIQPIEALSSAIDESDWFIFANKMGIIHGETFGLPFAADAMGLIMHEDVFGSEYVSLIEASRRLGTIAFAAGDPDTAVPFILYQSIGGKVEDKHGQPTIELEYLSNMLASIEENRRLGVFSPALIEYQSDNQIWEALSENEFMGVLTWISYPLAEANNYYISPLPGIGSQPYTYASGWTWCLVDKKNTNQELSVSFMEHMIDPLFLSEWTPKTAYLPVRPSSIIGWDETLQVTLTNILFSADLMPNETVLSFAKSDIIKAVQDLLQGLSTSEESTQQISERLELAQDQ
jgi:ABC-type glycerol-3-phosphate transport system substrate-binding protein